MTPQEALAQALGRVAERYGTLPPYGYAAAILDALRELDADIITKSDHSTGMRLWTTAWEQGAQQERERLRALVLAEEDVHEPAVRFTLAYILDLLADPEDAR